MPLFNCFLIIPVVSSWFSKKKVAKFKMFADIFVKPLKFLTFAGIWIDRDSSIQQIALAVLSHFIFIDAFLMITIIHICSVETTVEFFKLIEDVLFFIALFATTIIVISKKSDIENLLEEAKEMEELCIKDTGGKKLQNQINGVNRIFLGTIGIFSIFALFRSVVFIAMRELPAEIWLPYDYKSNSILFWLTLIHQASGSIVFVPVYFICHYLSKFFIGFAIGAVKELNEKMEKILENPPKVEDEEPSTSNGQNPRHLLRQAQKLKKQQEKHLEELLECIKVHLRIKAFVKEIENVFGILLGIQGALSVFIICTSSITLIIVS
jgi:hypothetical protein